MAESIGANIEEVGFDVAAISKHAEGFKAKAEAKKLEIEKAKKSQKKDIVRVSSIGSSRQLQLYCLIT